MKFDRQSQSQSVVEFFIASSFVLEGELYLVAAQDFGQVLQRYWLFSSAESCES